MKTRIQKLLQRIDGVYSRMLQTEHTNTYRHHYNAYIRLTNELIELKIRDENINQ